LKLPVYLDDHATTPCDPRVVAKMTPYFTERFWNASSRHEPGKRALEAVEEARVRAAHLLCAQAREIIFTSGATEANNIAIFGAAEAYRDKGDHFITSMIEHKSVLDCYKHLEDRGAKVTWLRVDRNGQIDLDELDRAIGPKTVMVSIMFANNEIGTLQHVAAIGRLAHEHGILFHCDAAQACGKVTVDVEKMGIDLLSLSGHKFYAPKGVGALYIRAQGPRVRLSPILHGGGQERGFRSGTLNVPGIVGLGEACRIAESEMETESTRISLLRDRLRVRITDHLDGVHINGHPMERLPNNLNVSFEGVEGEQLLSSLEDLAVTSGAACTSASVEPSYVLRAIGVPDFLALASIRFGLGRFTTEEEIDYAAGRVVEQVVKLRALAAPKNAKKSGRRSSGLVETKESS